MRRYFLTTHYKCNNDKIVGKFCVHSGKKWVSVANMNPTIAISADYLTVIIASRHGHVFTLLALCEGNPPVTGGLPSQRASIEALNCHSASLLWVETGNTADGGFIRLKVCRDCNNQNVQTPSITHIWIQYSWRLLHDINVVKRKVISLKHLPTRSVSDDCSLNR